VGSGLYVDERAGTTNDPCPWLYGNVSESWRTGGGVSSRPGHQWGAGRECAGARTKFCRWRQSAVPVYGYGRNMARTHLAQPPPPVAGAYSRHSDVSMLVSGAYAHLQNSRSCRIPRKNSSRSWSAEPWRLGFAHRPRR
jgi:hypothetical protein